MKADNHSGPDPIISRSTARFAIVLFLTLFTLGMVLFTWREFSAVPGEDHWIDPVLAVLQTGSPFSAMLVVLYVLFAARLYCRRAEEHSCLRYRQGLEDGRTQAAERFGRDTYDMWKSWTEWRQQVEAARVEGRPDPEPPPGQQTPVIDAGSLRTPHNHGPGPPAGECQWESPESGTPTQSSR